MRSPTLLLALYACLGGFMTVMGCGGQEEHAQLQATVAEQRSELAAANEQVTAMKMQLETLSTRLSAVEGVTSCVDRRIKAMQAWSRHKPKWGRCYDISYGKCKSTGLKPNSITPYRSRLRTVFNLINAANFKAAAIALDKLKFPVPTVDRWYEKEKITKAEWLEMRAKAEAMTRSYLVECGGVTTAAEPGETLRLDKAKGAESDDTSDESPKSP